MPNSKSSVLIVEDDSRISRVAHSHLQKAFPGVRVEIAGSAAKAKQICEKFPPTFIIWDGAPNERGTQEEYLDCIPAELWSRVIPISVDEGVLQLARERGAREPIPKKEDAVNAWSEQVVAVLRSLLPQQKKS